MQFYFEQYKLKLIYNSKQAYELLEEKYKQKRFGNYQNFETNIKENSNEIEKSELKKYKIKTYDDYKEYLCIDNYNNYYIFKEKKPMEYTVLLDQYTIEDKIFLDEYNRVADSEKAQMNLNLFGQMINRHDYKSAYNKLNDEFKKEYFSNINDFIKYVKENMYNYCKFNYEEVTANESIYKIKTSILNKENEKESKTKRFIVELQEKGAYNVAFNM